MSILLITHDLGVVAGMAHRVAVMYAGRDRRGGRARSLLPRARSIRTRRSCSPRCRRPASAAPSWRSSAARCRRSPGEFQRLPLRRSLRLCVRSLPAEAPRLDGAWRRAIASRCHLRETERAGPIASAPGAPRSRVWTPAGVRVPCSRCSDLKVHFPIRKGVLKRTVGSREGGRRRVARDRAGPHARAGRRVGLRQDDRRQGASCSSSGRPPARCVRRRAS